MSLLSPQNWFTAWWPISPFCEHPVYYVTPQYPPPSPRRWMCGRGGAASSAHTWRCPPPLAGSASPPHTPSAPTHTTRSQTPCPGLGPVMCPLMTILMTEYWVVRHLAGDVALLAVFEQDPGGVVVLVLVLARPRAPVGDADWPPVVGHDIPVSEYETFLFKCSLPFKIF